MKALEQHSLDDLERLWLAERAKARNPWLPEASRARARRALAGVELALELDHQARPHPSRAVQDPDALTLPVDAFAARPQLTPLEQAAQPQRAPERAATERSR